MAFAHLLHLTLLTDRPLTLGIVTILAIAAIAIVLHARDRAAHPGYTLDASLTILAVALTLFTTSVLLDTGHSPANPTGDPAAVFFPAPAHADSHTLKTI